jgi:cytochrome c oxidase subunit 2
VKMNVAPAGAYEIRVTAQQWGFTYTYPNGATSVDKLYVPKGREVKMKMSSKDVLHGFFIPAFRVKYDILPNRYTSVWFKATEKGEYDLFCTEYCGDKHSEMVSTVEVMPPDKFEEWVEGAKLPDDLPLPELGKRLYSTQQCKNCHSLDGSRVVGPSFKGLYGMKNHKMSDGSTVTVDENYLRQSILNPNAKVVKGYPAAMPPNYSNLSERKLSALIAFMKEQSDKKAPASDADRTATGQGAN